MTQFPKGDREGFVEVPGGGDWYKVVGDGDAIPLLTLHGGPGAGHDYLESLESLASDRPVIFFDQLGCGKSDQPDDTSLWNIERFVEEVEAVRTGLGLAKVHLLGHSWGGWLAIEYMLSGPSGIESLTLASTSASITEFVEAAQLLKAGLPKDVRETLDKYEASGEYDNPEYEEALIAFYQYHLCRLDPWPDALMRTVANIDGNLVYATMNGPSEYVVVGNLKNWDRYSRLSEIQVPTLITVGRFDEITPNCAATLHKGIAGSQIQIFEQSAHMAHLEETELYLSTLRRFIQGVESP